MSKGRVVANNAPTFIIVDATGEPSDAAVSALARLLLTAADREIKNEKKEKQNAIIKK